MSVLKFLFGAALGLCMAASAQAQIAPDLSKLPVEEMCRTDGAYGLKFGDTSLPPVTSKSERLEPRTPLNARFSPFAKVALITTEWSNQFYGAAYGYKTPDKAERAAVIKALAQRMDATGWTKVDGDALAKSGALDDLGKYSFVYFPPMEGEYVYFSDPADVNRTIPQGVYVRINEEMGQVYFGCYEPGLAKVQIKEAFGDLPPETPRPMPPVNPLKAAGIGALDCKTPAGLEQALAIIKPTDGPRAYHYPLRAFDYNTRLRTWKLSQIEHRAKLTRDQASDLALSTMDNKTFGPAFGNMGVMVAILELEDRAVKAEDQGDKAALCLATDQIFAANVELEKGWAPFVAATNAKIDAAAKKLGVRFD